MQQTIVKHSLTHPQKRVWYNEQIYPNTSMYNIGGMVLINGEINFTILEKAIQLFIKKNDGLRLRIFQQHREPHQYISPFEPTPIRLIDFSNHHNPSLEARKWAQDEFQKQIPLEGGPLFEFVLLKISNVESSYFVKFHHIIADGWTIQLMTSQIIDFYSKLKNDEHINDTVESTYLSYLQAEEKYLESPRYVKNKNYWNEKFMNLPDFFLSKTSHSLEGKRKIFLIEKEKSVALQCFIQKHRISMNTLFSTFMLIYIHKMYDQSDIIIGSPVLNRSGVLEKKIVGMFTSTMPLRLNVDEDESVLSFIKRVNHEIKQCLFHQRYPYNLLVKDLQLTSKGYDGLFQYSVNYYNTKLKNTIDGFSLENVEFYSGYQAYSLQLVIKEWADEGLEIQYDYKVADFEEDQINCMHERFLALIEQVLRNEDQSIKELSLLSDDEQKFMLEKFNNTAVVYPKEKTIQELFEEQVKQTPEKIAIQHADRSMTYLELNKKSNQLARKLREKGVKNGQVVGILAKHSLEIVIAIWGVIKAGGTYLPIDPSYPEDRIRYILNDSGTTLLLTDYTNEGNLEYLGEKINICDQKLYEGDNANLNLVNAPNDPIYIIYTSGTTGNPKGTVITQCGLVNYISWAKKNYISSENDVFALYSSVSFDLTVTSIFTPLISGLLLVIYHDNEDEFILSKILKENVVTVLKVTPSHLALLNNYSPPRVSSLRRLIVGGEDLKTSVAEKIYDLFSGKVEIINEYGPTETVVGCMIHRYDPDLDRRASVPIGTPADNVQIYLLDKNLQPVPIGVKGEIYISGDGVAKGYLNRPDLTAQRFLSNPFISSEKMYRSGDLAVMLPNGLIEYQGRMDSQVKVKGYRIEIGEVENALLQHKSVKDVVVVNWQGEDNSNHLVAYIVLKDSVQNIEIRSFISHMLPSYMIPSFFIYMDQLPLTINGKVDRQALPDPMLNNDSNYTHLEEVDEDVTGMVSEVLKEILQTDRIELHSNFYHLGGDSIKAIQVSARLQELGWKVRVKDVLNYPVISELAAMLVKQKDVTVSQTLVTGKIEPTPIMRWFLDQQFKNPHHWNQSVLLSLKKPVKEEYVNKMLNTIMHHHDLLRLRYEDKQDYFYYDEDMSIVDSKVTMFDLSEIPIEMALNQVHIKGEELKGSLNLNVGPLFKGALFQLSNDQQLLLLTAHHLIVDAVSWRILIEDANRCLNSLYLGEVPSLPLKTNSFQDWSEALNSRGVNLVRAELDYWESIDNMLDNNFQINREKENSTVESCTTLTFTLNADDTRKLLTTANVPYNTQPMELLLAVLTENLGKYTNQDQIKFELEGHGREELFEHLDISRTVGWFTTMYPIVLKVSHNIANQIKSVKEEVRKRPNKGIGYGILKEKFPSCKDLTQNIIRFNYLGEIDNSLGDGWFTIVDYQSGSEQSKDNHITALLDIVAMVKNKSLEIHVTFSTSHFQKNFVENLFSDYLERLQTYIQSCCQMQTKEFTSSDFETLNLSDEEIDNLFD
ncbi:amino acid adenylation domain-containing protein (plasmid) [Bacillus cereus]|uniref:amino acid adenylation domain-containing protein n=1 Tax=Bacillus cereus TaxID=1396 RepID=UPI001FF1DF12|nr:amino acid adenylation domain-containing protein [Bacillus cereus]UOX98968.1 amino acid adenylation domain-containing protein [Bacillus cereus]